MPPLACPTSLPPLFNVRGSSTHVALPAELFNSRVPLTTVPAEVLPRPPAVWIEYQPGSARTSDDSAPPARDPQPAWRVICGDSLSSGRRNAVPPGENLLRLAPGQGVRIRLESDPVRLEPLQPGGG